MAVAKSISDSDFPTVLEQFYIWEKERADKPYLHQPIDGLIKTYTWGEVADTARKLANQLKNQGCQPGDRVGILSKNCAEWFISDLAIMLAECVSVPVFATAGQDTIQYVCEHSGLKVMFVGKLDDTERQVAAIPGDVQTVAFPYPNIPAKQQWQDFCDIEPLPNSPVPEKESISTIIYTSGSTGRPKGVVHTYNSINWSAINVGKLLQAKESDRVLSYLPLAHITERVWIEMSSLYTGFQIWFVEALDTFQRDVQVCAPTFFVSVPRLWTKFQMGILAKMPQKKLDLLLRIPVLSSVVKKKIRTGLGLHQARLFGSGSAPLPPALMHWFSRLGVDISEGWGMTENCAYGTTCLPFRHDKIGTIGRLHDGVEIRISEEGEIQVKGLCNMVEYYLEPEKTAEAFTEDGYFRTGDKGEMDQDGYVKITGRLKEIFKTSKGKYVTPAPIEAKFMANPSIEQVCVTGSARPQPVALVVLSEEGAKVPAENMDKLLEKQLSDINSGLESHQRIDHVIICHEPWTVENNLLTPTLKVRRHILEEKMEATINGDYSQPVVRI